MEKIRIYTDGGCRGNGKENNKGAYAAILLHEKNGVIRKKTVCKYEKETTNNIMELTAILRGLQLLKYRCDVTIYSDSQYSIDCLSKWIINWQKNNWRTSNKKPVKNKDLLMKIFEETKKHKIEYVHVDGHSGVQHNEECDSLVNYAMDFQLTEEEIKSETINVKIASSM